MTTYTVLGLDPHRTAVNLRSEVATGLTTRAAADRVMVEAVSQGWSGLIIREDEHETEDEDES